MNILFSMILITFKTHIHKIWALKYANVGRAKDPPDIPNFCRTSFPKEPNTLVKSSESEEV